MTVGEHLKFYVRLKGTAPHRLELEIDMYISLTFVSKQNKRLSKSAILLARRSIFDIYLGIETHSGLGKILLLCNEVQNLPVTTFILFVETKATYY